MSADLMVCAQGVRKSFGRLTVLSDINLDVHRGEVLCLLGPSGSGKSTFLRCVNHLEKIDAGTLQVEGDTSATGASATSFMSSPPDASPGSAPRSAWCSSTSTCSRT